MAKAGSSKAYLPKPFITTARSENRGMADTQDVDSDDQAGDDDDNGYSSSEDVTEDEEGDELTPAMDAAILQTLRKIREGRGVYGKEDVLAEALKEAQERVMSLGGMERLKREAKSKPVTVAEHRRAELLAELDGHDETQTEPTYVESQRQLRQDAIAAFKSLDDEEEGEDDFDFTERPRTNAEEEREAQEYRKFLLDMGGGEDKVRKLLGFSGGQVDVEETEDVDELLIEAVEDEDAGKIRKPQPGKGGKKPQADEDFLMDYILNRGWIDRSDRHVPTYDEIVGPEDPIGQDVDGDHHNGDSGNAEAGPSQPWGMLDEDEFDEKAEEFENAYNFRYEEPGADTIHTHPRTIETLVRRPDEARKAKRAARAEKKAAEREALEEKTRRRKGEKRREMEQQLGELKKELGSNFNWEEVESVLEGDFDEDVWERVVGDMLAKIGEDDDDKPTWDEDGDDYEYEAGADSQFEGPGQDDEYQLEHAPINMDADFIGVEPKKKKKKDKKKEKERAEIEADLTVPQRAEKVKEAMEEYRALDHEDMIGDLPTRFKYTRSAPQSFGLSPIEILFASDSELNAIAGMKHLAPYRQRKGFGKTGRGLDKRVRDLKGELRARRWGEDPPKQYTQRFGALGEGTGANDIAVHDEGEKRKGKRMGKKERMKARIATGAVDEGYNAPATAERGVDANDHSRISKGEESDVSKKRKEREADGVEGEPTGGEGKKKRRKKKKKHDKGGETILEIYD